MAADIQRAYTPDNPLMQPVQLTPEERLNKKRACNRDYMRKWRKAHPEEARARVRASLAAHPETLERQQRNFLAWCEAHPEEAKVRAQQRQKTWNEKHPGEATVRTKAWRKANPDKKRTNDSRRRARKYNAPLNDFTAAQWIEMKALYKQRCAYCGEKPEKLTMDHITPLCKGGSHTASNILPACQACNFRKHTGEAPVSVQPVLLLEASSKPGNIKWRLAAIRQALGV